MADELETTGSEGGAVATDVSGAEPGSEADAKGPPTPPAAVSESDSASEPEKPADAEPEKPVVEETPRESAIARALRGREAKLVERQTQFARERQEWEGYTAKLKPQIEAFHADVALAKSDPFKFLEKVAGLNEGDLARRWINGGQPSPAELARQEKTKLDKELEELKSWRASQEAEKEAVAKTAQRESAQRAAETKLVELTKSNAAKYPVAARLSAADLIEEANDIAAASRAPLSFAQILDKIEARAKRFGGAPSATAPTKENAVQAASKGTEKQGQKGQEASAAQSGKTAPTLNGKDAAQRTSMPKDDPLLLDPEEERRRVIAEIDRVKKERNATA